MLTIKMTRRGRGVWNFPNLVDVTCEQPLDLARLKAESGGLVFENPFAQKVPKVKQGHSKTKRPQRWNWKVNFWPRLNSPLLAINLGPAFKNSQSCSSQHCHNKRWKNHEEWRSQLCSSSSWLFSTSLRVAAMKMVVASVHLKLERWSLQRRARIGKIATMKKVSFVAADGTSDKNFGTASAQKSYNDLYDSWKQYELVNGRILENVFWEKIKSFPFGSTSAHMCPCEQSKSKILSVTKPCE